MNAPSGMALAPLATVVVFGVVPENVPPFCEPEPPAVCDPTAEAGDDKTADDGVYLTDVVSALEPADADADEENEVTAPAPLAPDEALA